MADVREPYILWVDSRGALQSLQKREMRGVRRFAKSVDDKVLCALNELYCFVRDFAAICEISEGVLRCFFSFAVGGRALRACRVGRAV